ncbi:unnamed protein product [Leptosia nina]|uniref:Uncharacterized protein n=1 Tax=Leptosia nina TaxID=320188 RepID=A0AAV1J0J2_9NEOP
MCRYYLRSRLAASGHHAPGGSRRFTGHRNRCRPIIEGKNVNELFERPTRRDTLKKASTPSVSLNGVSASEADDV